MRVPFIRHVVSTVGISVLQQFVGLARQIMIAAFYGLSREFDAYLVALAVATIVVFNLSSIFDAVAVSRLVQIREREGEGALWLSSNRLSTLWRHTRVLRSCSLAPTRSVQTLAAAHSISPRYRNPALGR